MNDRQRGAAHVPMMFFLLLLAMFLGALGFAYVTFTENGKLQEDLKTARAAQETSQKKAVLVDHYIEDLGRVIGKPGKYEGREGQTAAYGGATLDAPGVVNPKDLKKVLDDACATEYAVCVAARTHLGRAISTEDAQIASVALVHGLSLATRNEKDFKGIHGLVVSNPWA